MEKCEGVEVLSELKQLHTLSLWLSALFPGTMFLSPACVFSTCVEKRMATSPHFSQALPKIGRAHVSSHSQLCRNYRLWMGCLPFMP